MKMSVSAIGALLVVAVLLGCGGGAPHKSGVQPMPDGGAVVRLPVPGGAIHVLADDFNGDGLKDLAVVNHRRNFARILINEGQDVWRIAGDLPEVGYHPKDMIALPGFGGIYYLNNSEGSGRLRVFSVQDDGRFLLHREIEQSDPRTSVAFDWPGWGLSLAVVGYESPDLTLLRGFDPVAGQYDGRTVVSGVARKRIGDKVLAVDLDGDELAELYLTDLDGGAVYRIQPFAPGATPEVELLAKVAEGGFAGKSLGLADADGDGRRDLIVPSHNLPVINVLLNRGAEFEMGQPLTWPFAAGPSAVVGVKAGARWMVAAGGYEGLSLYRFGEGGAVERADLAVQHGNGVEFLAVADLDSDGHEDLIVTLHKGESSVLYIKGPLWEAFEQRQGHILQP